MFLSLLTAVLLSPQVDTLETAVVYGTRKVVQVQRLEGNTLEKLSSESVADALRHFSGIQIKDYGGVGGIKTVNVRSLGAQHTGIYYNGVKITNAQNGQVDLGRFSLDNIESISLYNGQKSEVLQTAADYASAASVYIQTKLPHKTETKVSLKSGSFATVNPAIYQSFVRNDFKASISADLLSTSGKYKFTYSTPKYDTTAVRTNGDVLAARAEALISFKGLKITSYFYTSDRGLPGPVIRRVSDQFLTKDRQQDRDFFVQAQYRKFYEKLSFQAIAKFSNNWTHYTSSPSLNAAAMPLDNNYNQHEAYLSGAFAYYPTHWLSLGASLDGSWNDLNSDVAGFYYSQRLTARAAANVLVDFKGLKFIATCLYTGTKDWNEYTSTNRNIVTPVFIASYKLGPVTFRAFYKEIYRLPTFNDLFYTTSGRRDLKPEYTKQLDFGVELNLPLGFHLDADYYRTRVWDKIVAMPIQNQFSWSMVNFGEVRGYGFNLNLDNNQKFGHFNFNSRLSFTYEIARDYTNPKSAWFKGLIPYTPPYSGSAIFGCDYKSQGFSLSFIYTGIRYRDVANIKDNMLDPWMTTDLTIYKELNIRNSRLRISVDLNNLFNQPYEVVARYPMPGFNILSKITFTF